MQEERKAGEQTGGGEKFVLAGIEEEAARYDNRRSRKYLALLSGAVGAARPRGTQLHQPETALERQRPGREHLGKTAMKTASTLLQTLALSALLAAQVHGAITIPGARQALRTIAGQPSQIFCSSGVHATVEGHAGAVSIEPCP